MKNTSLSRLLEEEGYIRIALSRSGVGHFYTEGTLNGHSVSVLIDTGANTTIVNLDVVHRFGLEANKAPERVRRALTSTSSRGRIWP